ncbi:glycosyltransferase [Acinetobacter radioresistens]|uniref:glycosyltransferase n=1 Tax=Acinetobacter radioresistens TaxID=40216 RepID=UPI00037A562A|nr:glycosyltransferase [Acinetobacter radioresistens]
MDRAGAETMLMNLYRHIDRTQVQFDFITFTPDKGDYDDEILALGGRIFPILANNPIERMLKLTAFLKEHSEYQIVHAHQLLSNALHLLAAKRAGVKNLISHAHSTSNGKTGFINKIYEKIALITIRRISTHKFACGKLAAKYLYGNDKHIWIIPNSVNILGMQIIAEKSKSYIEDKLQGSGLKIIQVGRIYNIKNQHFSLKIAEELKNRNIEFTLYIVGQGPLESYIKQEIQNKSLSKNVKMLGIRSDITELMASADFMIMPSLHEGFPVVLVESQAVGLHTLVSDRVSAEVDFGLGLIHFFSITSEKEWVDYLEKPTKSPLSNDIIYQKIQEAGFDVIENANSLLSFYKTCSQ